MYKKIQGDDNSTLNQVLIVHKVDGTNRVFRPSKKGYDIKNDVAHVFVYIVDSNKPKYTL